MVKPSWVEIEDFEMPDSENLLKFIQLTLFRSWNKIEQYDID